MTRMMINLTRRREPAVTGGNDGQTQTNRANVVVLVRQEHDPLHVQKGATYVRVREDHAGREAEGQVESRQREVRSGQGHYG